MKKGISLIVLIITIVVIIILATAIIVNLAQTNIINNANEAVVKQDFKAMQDELTLYIADKYTETLGEFNAKDLNVTAKNKIAKIIPSIKNSKYEDYLVIENGEIVVTEDMPEPQKTWAMEALNTTKISSSKPTEPGEIGLVTALASTYTEITAKITVIEGEVEKYYFRLGDSGQYIESNTNEYTFEGLNVNTEYTVYMKVVDTDENESKEYTETIVTKDIEGIVTITKDPEIASGEYIADNIKATLSYEGVIPEGYGLEYKTNEIDWTIYTEEIIISSNTTVKARLYNKTTKDEKASNSTTVACIDKDGPSVPTTLNLTVSGTTIAAVASGSTDELSGEVTYEYSIDNTTWQTSGTFEGLNSHTTYTIYARAKDKLGNVSQVKEGSATTKYGKTAVNIIVSGENKTITGEDPTYNNPVIPVGFKAINTTEASWTDTNSDGIVDNWNNGLVIRDSKDNEFVWVPCTINGTNGTVTYAKNFGYPSSYSATSSNTKDDADAIPVSDETTQIKKYGGFYVGRYEAGIPENQTTIDATSADTTNTTGTPVVKQGAKVWVYIDYTNANANAKSFINTANIKSGLVTGKQRDTLMTWVANSGINVADSLTWGNYYDSSTGAGSRQTAGYSEYWKAKNIYDLAGNAWEWTAEIYSTSYCIQRGGSAYNGSNLPASYRRANEITSCANGMSFRIVLYIM